jgi:chromate reductase, NAD(P)H dehydrogenase (quinone)
MDTACARIVESHRFRVMEAPVMPDAQHREPVRFLAFSASLRAESLNSELIRLATTTIEANQGEVDLAAMHDFDVRSYNADVKSREGFPPAAEEFRRRLEASDAFVIAAPSTTFRCLGF